MSSNPLFPVAIGGIAAALFYLIKEARCECHARKQQQQALGPQAQNKKGHTLSNVHASLKDIVSDPRFTSDKLMLVSIERGIRGSVKYTWRTHTGQILITYAPVKVVNA